MPTLRDQAKSKTLSVDFMRAVDRFAGIPLCHLTALVPAPPARTVVRRILVIKFFGLGSIILTTPALTILRAAFPDARIDMLTFRSQAGLAERLPQLDHVHTVDPDDIASMVASSLGVISSIRAMNYDCVLDFEFFSKYSTLMSAWSGAPRRIGFELPVRWRTKLLTDAVPLSKDSHVANAFAEQAFVLAPRGPMPGLSGPRITDDDRNYVSSILLRTAPMEIVMHVNTGPAFPERRWRGEYFAEVVRKLHVPAATSFAFIGTASERTYVQDVIERTGLSECCRNVAGMLSVPQLGALLKRSSLVVSNDSGPAHIAAALGVPVLAMYGPESPEFYGLIGTRTRAIYHRTECSPCMNVYNAKAFVCPFNARCMEQIGVDEIVAASRQLLGMSVRNTLRPAAR
jgi:lipopolysaccharide heptosyltransferase II